MAANYVSSQAADFTDNQWNITAQDEISGDTFPKQAKVLINAAGPAVVQ